MFGNNDNTTSDLMLPILLDMANLIRRAVRSGKEPREVKQPLQLPQAQLLRRSFTEDTYLDDEPFDTGINTVNTVTTTKAPRTRRPLRTPYRKTQDKVTTHNTTDSKVTNNTANIENDIVSIKLYNDLHLISVEKVIVTINNRMFLVKQIKNKKILYTM